MVADFAIRISSVLLVATCFSYSTAASEVFTWQDKNGITHYSQWPPDNVTDVSKLVVNSANPPGYDPHDDPYSIRNQAVRMNETWKQLEERKDERREQKREERERTARDVPPPSEPYRYYTPPLFYRPIHRPFHRAIHRAKTFPHRPRHLRPVQPRQSKTTVSFSPDPMRSAHIGVRRSPAPNSPARIE